MVRGVEFIRGYDREWVGMFYIKSERRVVVREGWGEFLVADVSWLGLWY
jgi:hypothetical protein